MKKRILIADDEAAMLHTMAFTLKRKGYEVETVSDGERAYKKIMEKYFNHKIYDLLITDIQMPGLSGLELILRIRAAGISTPILAITGFRNKHMSAELLQAGCQDFIDKPFSMNEFIDHISKLLN